MLAVLCFFCLVFLGSCVVSCPCCITRFAVFNIYVVTHSGTGSVPVLAHCSKAVLVQFGSEVGLGLRLGLGLGLGRDGDLGLGLGLVSWG